MQGHSVELRSGWKADDSECIGIARILEATKDFVRILALIIRIYKQISEKCQRKYLQHIGDLVICQRISRYNSKALVLILMRKVKQLFLVFWPAIVTHDFCVKSGILVPSHLLVIE